LETINTLLMDNWLLVAAHPMSFVLCALLFLGLGYLFSNHVYGKRNRTSQSRLANARDELARLENVLADEREDFNYHRAEADALRIDIERLSAIISGEKPLDSDADQGAIHKQIAGNTQTNQLLSAHLFLREPEHCIEEAMKKASVINKLLFVIIYDPAHPTKSNLSYSLGHFLQYQTTRKLVDQSFVCVLVSVLDETAKALVPGEDALDNCRWVVLNEAGDVLRSESVYANADEGLIRTREVIEHIEVLDK